MGARGSCSRLYLISVDRPSSPPWSAGVSGTQCAQPSADASQPSVGKVSGLEGFVCSERTRVKLWLSVWSPCTAGTDPPAPLQLHVQQGSARRLRGLLQHLRGKGRARGGVGCCGGGNVSSFAVYKQPCWRLPGDSTSICCCALS